MTGTYFIEERRQRILELLQAQERVTVKQLSSLFAVTEDAIRKDLRYLESLRRLKRTYGGAVLPSAPASFVPYADRGDALAKLPIARLAALARKAKVIQTGGIVHGEDEACYGFHALAALQHYNFDKCFMRTSGVGADGTVTTSLPETLELKRTLLPLAKQSILLVAEEQWNRKDRFNVGHLDEWSVVVTDSADEQVLGRLQQLEIRTVTPKAAAGSAS
ncbi:transcriptional regulator, DeoR family [Paenibacillus sp. UNCCL117]|uniref:DeoR/GlpR family DNA-binding transcription regulator n=1 Tax=unclassified Paenibacillus TaxID=185978 RepID=UPI000891EC54|nr:MULTISPECIES: DeoR/GlpR family DNA-binding transcription regulator [unclassified Paenibacillus]SDE51737.1 DNA-binding transcriptional regulator of sugar metabolism, DeoR/GlpR family [Paenibacillus sp. cl123]SFW67090.1 transcriptional regulator, DeoR family [Paenibacillus sp. UNCCL117]